MQKNYFFSYKICIIENKVVSLHPLFSPTPRTEGTWFDRVAEGDGPFVYRLGREIFIL